jgi:hypothetical protein
MKAYVKVDAQIHIFLTSALVEVSVQRYDPAALSPVIGFPAPILWEAGWTPEPVFFFKRKCYVFGNM